MNASDLLGWNTLNEAPPILGPIVRLIETHTGLTIQTVYRGFFYGNLAGGKNTGAAWNQEIRVTTTYEFGFLTEALAGLSFTSGVRWREGQDPNNFVGARRSFQPSHIDGGRHFRLRPFYLTYVTPELFGVTNLLTISGGWQNPYDIFLQQPISKLFVNRAIYTDKGLGPNIPWTGSYVAWGGYFKIAPTHWMYGQAGFYVAAPGAAATQNHGVDFRGSRIPGKPNGLYIISEVGITPQIGPSQFPGKYVFGGFWYGAPSEDLTWNRNLGRYGFYWQADQLLFRMDSSAALTRNTIRNNTQIPQKELSFFSLFTYAPPYNNILPFYFHMGFDFQGIIPTRNSDQLSLCYAYGTYSSYFAAFNRSKHLPIATTQSVLEVDYKFMLTRWIAFKLFYQYLINPASNNTLRNANILGFQINSAF